MRLLLPALIGMLLCAPAAHASIAKEPWPPPARDPLFVHYGEEHFNDPDGAAILPRVVAESSRYRPDLVTMSGDKAGNGTADQLAAWLRFMEPYDRAGIPYFPATGNHDRRSPPVVPPGLQGLGLIPAGISSSQPYLDAFRNRPYPFGDAPPYPAPGFAARKRPAGDPAGASTRYYVDYSGVRWIFLDNSCWSVSRCDAFQNPPFPGDDGARGQFEWLERRAGEASRDGATVFVVMHVPTRDPRDQSYSEPSSREHVMGKSEAFADNLRFEEIAERTGVDAVFLGHIKGQFLYRGRGRVPYFVDGGAGGELHTTGPLGTDHGYWHGYRTVRVSRGRVITDTVPVFVQDGITLRGAERLRPGALERYRGFGRQPVVRGPAKVELLELRDPSPVRPGSGPGAVTVAQQGAPTTTPIESLPIPARMFATSDPLVLAPKARPDDDPRRDPATQTENGLFRARCPGIARVRVTSGFETTSKNVAVVSRPGRIVRSVGVTSRRRLRLRLRPRLRYAVAHVRLNQPAEVLIRVRRRGRTVRTLKHACVKAGRLTALWDGRRRRRGGLVRRGTYRIEVKVRSDRPTVRRSRTVRVR